MSIWNENVFNEKKKLSCWSAHWLPDKLSALLSTSWSKNEEYSLHYSNATDGVTKYTLHNLYWCINTSWPVCLVSFAAASTCSAAVWSPKRLPWHQNSLNSSGANSALRKDYIQTENIHTYISKEIWIIYTYGDMYVTPDLLCPPHTYWTTALHTCSSWLINCNLMHKQLSRKFWKMFGFRFKSRLKFYISSSLWYYIWRIWSVLRGHLCHHKAFRSKTLHLFGWVWHKISRQTALPTEQTRELCISLHTPTASSRLHYLDYSESAVHLKAQTTALHCKTGLIHDVLQ